MPNLPVATPELDVAMFDRVIYSHALQSDDWKIYPTIVTKTADRDEKEVHTVIEKWYNDGKYVPYSMEEVKQVILHAMIRVPRHVRISRVFRDIPMINIEGGANVPNLREELHKIMDANGDVCEWNYGKICHSLEVTKCKRISHYETHYAKSIDVGRCFGKCAYFVTVLPKQVTAALKI